MLPKMSVDVPMISELPKLFEAFPMVFDRIETQHFSTFWYSYDSYSTLRAVYLNIFEGIELNLNKLSGFVSQAWKIVLDVWDWRLWSTGVRLTHNARELAGIVMTMVMMMITMTTTCKLPYFFGYKAHSAIRRTPNFATRSCKVFKLKISLKHSVIRCTPNSGKNVSQVYSSHNWIRWY